MNNKKNKNNKKISVIIPVFDGEKYISRCLNSIMQQTYKNLEIIIVDDGSRDSTYEICKKYEHMDNRINLYSKSNGGVSSARNYGIKKSTGDVISFVDSDDYLEKTFYEKMISNMLYTNCDISICNYVISDKKKNCFKNNKIETFSAKKYPFYAYNNSGISGFVWNKIYSRNVICCKDVNPILFNERYINTEDDLFNYEILKKNPDIKYAYTNEKLYHYTIRGNSVSHELSYKKIISYFLVKEREISILESLDIKSVLLKADYVIKAYIYFKKLKIKMDKEDMNSSFLKHVYNAVENYKKQIKFNDIPFKFAIKYLIAKKLLSFRKKDIYERSYA